MTTIDHPTTNSPAQGQRMIVFVPGLLDNAADFSRQVYLLAIIERREVVYLAVNRAEEDRLAAARQLATLTALTQDKTVRASGHPVSGNDVMEVVRHLARPGDLILWPESSLMAPPALARELGITQQVLSWAYTSEAAPSSRWYRMALLWGMLLVILVGFTFLEARLPGLVIGAALKTALIIVFILECGALYLWNRLFR